MRTRFFSMPAIAALVAIISGCETSELPTETLVGGSSASGGPMAEVGGPFTFDPPVFDIAAASNGNVLVVTTVFPADPGPPPPPGTSTSTVHEIRLSGTGGVREIASITTTAGSAVNGLEAVGSGSFFATGAGLDEAFGAAVFHVSRGGQRLIGDIEAFETANDPDVLEGLEWKLASCEGFGPFTAGPQSNPYHLAPRSGGEALVADAAGNTLLSVTASGTVDWVAILPPATADGSGSANPADWLPFIPDPAECFVQPVPTSVAIGPDGAIYVGELTGLILADFGIPGPPASVEDLSRVWRIESGATHVACPSVDCTVALSGFTSIIDLEFGPQGELFVLEYDENGWAAATGTGIHDPPNPAGGTINRCDLSTASCSPVGADGDFSFPAAITFDAWGRLWVVEDNLTSPTVSLVELP